ncbi:MAG TPA: T9SS type A sorting domain-containing protein [Chitinophagaceae bacterium]|nr:T9SS type A sorting domain-containing protein [Chitinophagaceae bacterium]
MKKNLLLLISIVFGYMQSHAQAYVLGDISAMPILSGYHDSTQCASFSSESWQFTISNSFAGDVLTVKDQNSSMVMATITNTSGVNPWTFILNPMSLVPIVPDNMVVAGFANFPGTPMKFINGSDTIYNVTLFYQVPVPNPCTYGDVSGRIYIDNNSDCTYNTGDLPLQSIPAMAAANYTSSSGSQYGYSNTSGNYSMELQQSWLSNYTVSIPSAYQFIFPSTACSPASYSLTTLPQTGVDFSLQCTSQVDVQTAIATPPSARPAIPFMVHPYVSNTGCDSASGVLTMIKDANTVYNAALSTNPASYVNGDTLQWNYVNLTNLSNGSYWNSFMASVHLTPNTSVAIGDTLCFQIYTGITTGDVDTSNNHYSICIPVVNSYDPNAKEVFPAGNGPQGYIPVTTSSLEYTIHFQNTGTAPAINVSIIDTLDPGIQPSSLQILGTSHAMNPQWLSSNVVKFNFNGINLPDSNSNEAKSHGQIKIRCKLNPGLTVGTQIKNKAQIYFDSNPAIVTNTTLNTLATPSSVSENNTDASVRLYPNPAGDWLQIEGLKENAAYVIYSSDFKAVMDGKIQSGQAMNIQSLQPGLYFIRITQGTTRSMHRLIKL